MPVCDYVCPHCHKPFELVLSPERARQENPGCPHRGSKNVEGKAVAFFAVTSKKS